ncbi:MAG: T9SS type A sorting domain-containing protein [Bacteroidetes bacterium]|nr:T9SS type A sorting domain-containing protein [Bacteroidota bacterium]
MKKIYLLFVALAVLSLANVTAQNNYVNQVIVGSGGDFGNPDDHVSIASFIPENGITSNFGSINTHSIQDIAIAGKYAYVAAQDSIAKFDLDTYERVSIVEATGVNRLLVHETELLATFQYPVTDNFVKVYSTEDLSLTTTVTGISDESSGLLIVNDFAYVAVPGGWASTVGKIAIVGLNDYTLVDEIDFDAVGSGMMDLFYFNNKIQALCITPWGGSTGYINSMSKLGTSIESHLINESIGKIAGIQNNILYTIMNGGIGSIDLSNFSVIDTTVVETPELSISSAKLDTLNNVFYVATTDYFSMGEGTIYNMNGDETGSFDAAIAPDAIAIDYRNNTGTNEITLTEITLFPNPASHVITINTYEGVNFNTYKIIDLSGRVLMEDAIGINNGKAIIDISNMINGFYIVNLLGENEFSTSTFIKK